MAAYNGWVKADDGTVKQVGVWSPNWTDGYGTISIETQPTFFRRDWKYCFGKLLGAAKAVQECVNGKRSISPIGKRPSPLFCLLTAQVVCSRFVKAHHEKLRFTRMSLPTPPEYSSLIARPYCEFAIDSISGWWNYLSIFVQHDGESIKLQGEDRITNEVQQILARWNEVVASPPKWFSLDIEVLVRLVAIEIEQSHWMTDEDLTTAVPAKRGGGNKTGKVTDWDRKTVRDYIAEYKGRFNGTSPSQSAIKKGISGKGVGSGKLQLILEEFRESGEFVTKPRSGRNT